MARAPVIIDIRNDDFPGGSCALGDGYAEIRSAADV